MKHVVRVLGVLLALTVSVSLFPLEAFAAENNVEITLADSYLFHALCEELGPDGMNILTESDGDNLLLCMDAGDLEKVTALQLNNRYITDLTGLEAFTALEELNLANNMAASLEAVSGLKNLTSLDASGNLVSDIRPVLGLTGLRRLDLAKNKLKDAAGSDENCVTEQLRVLTGLKELDLSHNSLRYTSGLEALTGLTRLELYSNYIRDLSGLEGLSELTFLNLGENNETSVTEITGLSALRSLQSLRWLDFSENNTPEIVRYIEDLGELEHLCLNQNRIEDISGLAKLSNLRELELFYNQITTIEPLLGLSRLETLSVQQNKIQSLSGIYTENRDGERELAWPRLQKLDTAQNWGGGSQNQMWRSEELKFLRTLSQEERLEWNHNYNPVYDPEQEGLPHTDPDTGVKYVTYEDFGARCNGVYDDYIAMKDAHNFANSYAKKYPAETVEVRGVPGKTYHYFNEFGPAVTVNTNVDWRGATIAIHDEHLERRYGRSPATRVFRLSNTDSGDRITIENPDWTIGTETKSLADKPEIMEAVEAFRARGFEEFFCIVKNEDHKQFIRYGGNANNGEAQQDRFKLDSAGNLLHDVIWDFEKITSLELFPVAKTPFVIQNAHMITYGAENRSEEVQGRSGKNIYWYRHLCFSACSNVQVSNIRHTVEPDEIGSYYGIIEFNNVVDAEVKDCVFFAHRCNNRSTYDFTVNSGVNLRFLRLTSNDIMDRTRWGITGMNYLKNVTYENCSLNHADVHMGAYNWTVRDSEIGTICLIGRGEANIINTHLYDDDFIELRQDYGTTFDGNINIIDCTFHYYGRYIEALMKSLFATENGGTTIHDFGCNLRFPNVYVENLTIDSQYAPESRNYMVLLTNWAGEGAAANVKGYWPDSFVVNGYRFINSGHMTFDSGVPALRFTASEEGSLEDVQFVLTDCRLTTADGTDLTSRVFQGEKTLADGPVMLRIQENASAENTVQIYRDGLEIVEAETVAGSFQQDFQEDGQYRVVIQSHQSLRTWITGEGWHYYNRDGEKTLEFTIAQTGIRLNAQLLSPDGSGVISGIPDGNFRVCAEIAAPENRELSGASLWFAGYSQTGQLLKLETRAVPENAEEVVIFEMDNPAGEIHAGKLFLLGPQMEPLSPCWQMGE